jgi:hypothetical protein
VPFHAKSWLTEDQVSYSVARVPSKNRGTFFHYHRIAESHQTDSVPVFESFPVSLATGFGYSV